MAGGWSRDGAVQNQIDASVEEAVSRVRSRLPAGEGLSQCEVCDAEIHEARRKAVPGVRLCVNARPKLTNGIRLLPASIGGRVKTAN